MTDPTKAPNCRIYSIIVEFIRILFILLLFDYYSIIIVRLLFIRLLFLFDYLIIIIRLLLFSKNS